MLELFSVCGDWIFRESNWDFIIDGGKGSSISCIHEDIKYKELIGVILEDFGIDPLLNSIRISYGSALNFLSTSAHIPPIYIRTDRQLESFLKKFHPNGENDVKLCVTITQTNHIPTIDERAGNVRSQVLSDVESATNHSGVTCATEAPPAPLATAASPAPVAPPAPPVVIAERRYIPAFQGLPAPAAPPGPRFLVDETKGVPCVTTQTGVSGVEKSTVLGKRKITSTSSASSCDGVGICVGMKFNNKKEMSEFMRMFAIKNQFEFTSKLSDKSRYVLRCIDRDCCWRFRAANISGSLGFEVLHYVAEHDCDSSLRKVSHRQASSSILGNLVSSHFEGGKDGLKPRQIIESVRKEHGVVINYLKAWRAKEKGEEIARGSYSEGYEDLPKWLHILEQKNPGSATFLKVDDDGRFKYAFFSLAASIKGFSLLRKVIIVDGAFLKGKFKGVLLAASAQDGNFSLFPLAFAAVDSENDASWEWFFNCLSTVFPDCEDLVFVSDRAPSIARGLQLMYPKAFHGICFFHFEKNVEKHFKSTTVMSLVKAAAFAYIRTDFDELIREIQLADPDLATYLWEADYRKWARCHSPLNRYNIMTSNLAESLNSLLRKSRERPIVSLFDNVRLKLTKWFHDRREEGKRRRSLVTKEVGKKMKTMYDQKAKFYEVFPVNVIEYEVKGDVRSHVVNLQKRSCTCRVFDFEKIPCSHAIAAIKHIHLNENDFVDMYYFNQRWTLTYMESIHPHGDEAQWVVPPQVAAMRVLPPNTKIPSGRRKINRYKSYWEYGRYRSKSSTYKCGRCGQTGHNKATCVAAI